MVHLAMNRHLFVPGHGESLDIFFQPSRKDALNDGWGRLSQQARIVANELYICWRYRVVVPSSEGLQYIMPFALCPHIRQNIPNNSLTHILKCMLEHRDTGPCGNCSGLRQCLSCPMEYEIRIFGLDAVGHVLEFTSWKNLGSGRTLEDPKWAHHVGGLKNNYYRSTPYEFSPGSIRSAFESHQESLQKTPLNHKAFGNLASTLRGVFS